MFYVIRLKKQILLNHFTSTKSTQTKPTTTSSKAMPTEPPVPLQNEDYPQVTVENDYPCSIHMLLPLKPTTTDNRRACALCVHRQEMTDSKKQVVYNKVYTTCNTCKAACCIPCYWLAHTHPSKYVMVSEKLENPIISLTCVSLWKIYSVIVLINLVIHPNHPTLLK